jgi:parvulin-like peptidyl-prolyl isomerase
MPVLVNGERIEDQVIREEARSIRPKLEEAMAGEDPATIAARVKQWARENVVERTLLQQAAWGDPEPVPAEEIERNLAEIRPENGGSIAPGTEDFARKEIELRLRIDRLFARVCAHLAEPRHKDISEFYRKHREQFQRGPAIHAAHIVKNIDEKQDEAAARAGIEAALAALNAEGADFASVADQHSDCPGNGGELGWFPMGQMVDEFDAVVFRMEPGQVSPVFRTPFGFHIAKVLEKQPEGPMALEEVKDKIAETLMQEKRQKFIEQYLDKLWAAAKIEDVAG